jgi:hypothetical protein
MSRPTDNAALALATSDALANQPIDAVMTRCGATH